MTVFLDIASKDLISYNKGDILSISESHCSVDPSGRMVGVEITDATIAQALHYVKGWYNTFEYTIEDVVGASIPTKEIVLSVNRNILTLTGKELKQSMRLFLIQTWDADIITYDSSSVTFRMPSSTDFIKMKSELKDIFEEQVHPCIYHFTESDVDLVIANDGFMQITKAQALSRIVDRRL